MRPRLIVNADDFGLTPGINRAVEELHRAGVLSSATLMATGEAFTDAARIAQANPSLGVGCHLVFVDGVPVLDPAEVPGLFGARPTAFRSSLLSFGLAVLRGAIRMQDLQREAEAQVERLLQAGVNVTHVDTHKHVHCLPPVRDVVMAVARRYGIRARQVYEPGWSVSCSKTAWGRRWQARAAGVLGKPPGMSTDGTLGIAATGTLDAQTLRAMLARLPEGSVYELCCHPGYVDAALMRQRSRLVHTREVERLALLEVLPQFGLDLVHYGVLARRS